MPGDIKLTPFQNVAEYFVLLLLQMEQLEYVAVLNNDRAFVALLLDALFDWVDSFHGAYHIEQVAYF